MIVNLQQELVEMRNKQTESVDNYREEAENAINEMSEKVRTLEHSLKQKDEMVFYLIILFMII